MTTPDPFDDPRYWQEVWHSRGMTNKARHALLHAITAADLSEPLLCFDSTQDSDTIRDWMQQTELKVVGVRHNGFLSGFVTRTQLGTTWLGDDMIRFEDDFAVADTASPAVVIQKLSVLPWLFVRINGQVSGIITKTDLEKPESKLWLHGVLTLFKTDLKVNLLRAYSGTSWFECLSANNLATVTHAGAGASEARIRRRDRERLRVVRDGGRPDSRGLGAPGRVLGQGRVPELRRQHR